MAAAVVVDRGTFVRGRSIGACAGAVEQRCDGVEGSMGPNRKWGVI